MWAITLKILQDIFVILYQHVEDIEWACHVKIFIKIYIATMYVIKTLSLVSFILSMMVYIGLKFFSAPSPSWGMAFKSRSLTFHTNVEVFAYIIKAD